MNDSIQRDVIVGTLWSYVLCVYIDDGLKDPNAV